MNLNTKMGRPLSPIRAVSGLYTLGRVVSADKIECNCKCGHLIITSRRTYLAGKGCRRCVFSLHKVLLSLLKRYKIRAFKRNVSFSISLKEFFQLITSNCNYCGISPYQKANSRSSYKAFFLYNGIDRVDNDKGYDLENCVSCCGFCNRAKGSKSTKEFLDWLTFVRTTKDLCVQ